MLQGLGPTFSAGHEQDGHIDSEELHQAFGDMMKALYHQQGAQLRIEVLAQPGTRRFVQAHAQVLDQAMQQAPMTDAMRRRLSESNYVFSGMKAFHELHEAFPSLLDENGQRKTFEQFYNDVSSIDQTYNRHYLRAEYNFVHASAQMAARWEQFAQDGDDYLLQYRTAGDDRVRPEHAALNGVTLPMSDPFWKEYFPPNGWNCRCTVVQVRRGKYPVTPHRQAMERGRQATRHDRRGMFRFNPGAEQKSVPDYNPYTISRCKNCDVAKGKISLAFVPENEVCAACKIMHKLKQASYPQSRSKVRKAQKDLDNWSRHELPECMVGNSLAKRFVVNTTDNMEVIINRPFYNETINKFKNDPLYILKLEYAKKAHELIQKANLTNPNEASNDHPEATFRVYEYEDYMLSGRI